MSACYRKSHEMQEIDFEDNAIFWWPEQKIPEKIIVCSFHGNSVMEIMLGESLAGIAAKAVNNNTNDELIWLQNTNSRHKVWLQPILERLEISEVIEMDVWQLLQHFINKELIDGYVTYKYDKSKGKLYHARQGVDKSVNVATTVAGVLNAVLVEESQIHKVEAFNLKQLYDAGKKDYKSVFNAFQSRINTNMIMIVDPKAHNHRAFAISNNIFVFDGDSESEMDFFMSAINVSSPVLGWGFGDEFRFTSSASKAGLFTTATNWCTNLALMSAGAREVKYDEVASLSPNSIDWEQTGHFHSFILSDGDNMGWMQGNFFHNKSYWANQISGEFPFGWTTSSVHLSEMMPDALTYLTKTQAKNSTIIEYGGGYHYPDLFGSNTNSEEALRTHARKVNHHMKKSGVKVFGFIVYDHDSEEAKRAYQIYAEELEGITGMIAVQYSPYEGGDGKIFWPTNKAGMHIPVVTSKYSLWAGLPERFIRSGSPEKISDLIEKEASQAKLKGEEAISWTMVHAWSFFENDGEKERGLTPVKWTIEKLDKDINIVSPEEMLWRIRMKYYPDETNSILAQ
jgi:hypothetical protein